MLVDPSNAVLALIAPWVLVVAQTNSYIIWYIHTGTAAMMQSTCPKCSVIPKVRRTVPPSEKDGGGFFDKTPRFVMSDVDVEVDGHDRGMTIDGADSVFRIPHSVGRGGHVPYGMA